MFKLFSKLKWAEIEVSKMYLFIGLYVAVRASYFIFNKEDAFHESKFYVTLDDFIPLPVVGIIILAFSITYILGSFNIPTQQHKRVCNGIIFSGSIIGCIIYFIMASASFFTAINYISTFQFLIFSTWFLTNAFTSWGEIYDRRQ
ncbi:hypothetical protein [Staphylococcus xylosus]|uniref:hypothetical protein n=1 Tax=Staphylococcus xylosus TaxID=1288 RepID=UPI002DBB9518|nr:hypothetical protein [Staphylococcus xylosus]MEB8101065.1 hypothetical protein [Staphylococcus xylosus]